MLNRLSAIWKSLATITPAIPDFTVLAEHQRQELLIETPAAVANYSHICALFHVSVIVYTWKDIVSRVE